MFARPEDGHAHAFERADHKVGVVARDAGMGKARQVGVRDRHAVDRACQMAEARAEDQAKPHGGVARTRADELGEVVSVL